MKNQEQKRMTHKQKEEKFTPVVSLLLKSRQANAEMMKAKGDQKAQAKAAYEVAEKAAKAAQSDYSVADVRMLLEQFGQFIYRVAMVSTGNGKTKWDSKSTAWMAKGMYDVIDDRMLPRDDKDRANDQLSLKVRYLNLHLAFIAGCEAVGYTPKFKVILNNGKLEFVDFGDRSRSGKVIDTNYGLQEGTVREALNRLNAEVAKLTERAKATTDIVAKVKLNEEAGELNKLAGNLNRTLNSARLGYWLKERKPQEPMPEQVVDTATLPENVTVNSDKGIATLAQTLEPVESEAPTAPFSETRPS